MKKCKVCGIRFKNKYPGKVPSMYCSAGCAILIEKLTAQLNNHIRNMWTKNAPKESRKRLKCLLKDEFNSTKYNGYPEKIFQNLKN